jgi:peptidoglycan-associated lipoprotein
LLEVTLTIRIDVLLLSTCAALALVVGTPGCARRAAVTPPAAPATAPPVATTPEPPAPVEPAAPIPPPTMDPAFFGYDSHLLGESARTALDQVAKLLRDHAEFEVTIEGHCDERGTSEYNLALGERRARAARQYLVMAGVPIERVQIVTFGEERPFQQGHDEAAWANNRRAHFVVQQATLSGGASD